MDMLKIKSAMFRGLISKIVSSELKKKFGYDIRIMFDDIDIEYAPDGKAIAKFSAHAETNELPKIVKDMGV